MKKSSSKITLFFIAFLFTACSNNKKIITTYVPDDKKLYDTIVHLDSIFFNAYNTCDINLDVYSAFYSDSIEFYHDKGGIMTSKEEIVASTKKYVCGKVTRELIPGSIEVYPINNFGAIEVGFHRFHNNTEKETTPARAGRFVIVWHHTDKGWKISRVISLH
jgi:hypothetical protein